MIADPHLAAHHRVHLTVVFLDQTMDKLALHPARLLIVFYIDRLLFHGALYLVVYGC